MDTPPHGAGAAHARSAVLICSPRAQRNAAVKCALALVGITVAEEVEVSALRHAAPLGQKWRERGIAVAIAAGGDGTVGAVATQLAGSDLPLGILPLGTSNDVARSLALPLTLEKAAAVIATGTPRALDAGRAISTPEASGVGANGECAAYFLHALTLGVNVEFAHLATDLVRRRRWGRLNYATAALEAATRFVPLEATLRLEGVARRSAEAAPPDERGEIVVRQRVLQIAMVNLPIFGGALHLSLPGVQLHDSLLDVVVAEAPTWERMREVVQTWLEARRSTKGRVNVSSEGEDTVLPNDIAGITIPGITRYQARAATLTTASPVEVTLDGEICARTPLRVEAASGVIRVLLP